MKTYEHALEGFYEHKLDPKCRVSIPSDWRDSAGGGVLRLLRANTYSLPTLKVLTEAEFAETIETIESRDDWSRAQKKAMAGKLYSDCLRTKLNPQGKLLIPKALCSQQDIEPSGQVVLIGRGAYFEIMGPEHYEEMRIREEAEIAQLNADMDLF